MPTRSSHRLALVTFALLLPLLAWDATNLDMRTSQWFGGAQGFPLREYWLLTTVLHEGGRVVSWLLAIWLILGVWWPLGWLRRLTCAERVQLVSTALLAALMI